MAIIVEWGVDGVGGGDEWAWAIGSVGGADASFEVERGALLCV
jgi:hypothetical protein